mgnify:CR=1 FL=1
MGGQASRVRKIDDEMSLVGQGVEGTRRSSFSITSSSILQMLGIGESGQG